MVNITKHDAYDVLVVGGGISGCEAALNIANIGYKVLLVEKDLTVGGKMILLSKVFPSLDCGACITTPKLSELMRHPNITVLTQTEPKEIRKLGHRHFEASLISRPRYVIAKDCTGCQLCEDTCPVSVNDQYQYDMVGRKAVYIPFSIASPRTAAIDIENCVLCGACEKVCPTHAIDFTQEEESFRVNIKSVVTATGFNLFDPTLIPRYGYGFYKNVITSMQMERELAPTRPFNHVLRPSDGKQPDNIAYVLCTGSRDHSVGNKICSQICCMYSIKQAQLLMGALPMADITLYYINIRSFGKGFEEFYQQAKGMGVECIRGKIGKISEQENGDLSLRYEDFETGQVSEANHDLVVLSVGIMPNTEVNSLFVYEPLEADEHYFIKQPDIQTSPARTSIEGVFVAGTAAGPMDIPDSILSAGSTATETVAYLRK